MSSSIGRTTRKQHKDNQVKASKGQQTISTVRLRTRSKNVMNTPSPRNHLDPGEKLIQQASFLSKIYNDENSNPGSENNLTTNSQSVTNNRSRRKSSNETRYSVSTCQSDPASLGEHLNSPHADEKLENLVEKAEVETADFGVQVNFEDLDIPDGGEGKSLDYYKKLAESRLKDIEQITEDLNCSNVNLEEMSKVNESLVGENETLIKRCEEYEEQLEELVTIIENQSLENKDENNRGDNGGNNNEDNDETVTAEN